MANEKGFTLIEVLVAATILFMVLASALLSYNAAMQGSQRAARLVELAAVAEPVRQHIQKAIRDNVHAGASESLNGQTTILNVAVDWRAEVIARHAPPARFDPTFEDDVSYAERFLTYQVSLSMYYKGLQRDFEYLEFAWFDRVQPI